MTVLKSGTYSLATKAIETILNLALLAVLARILEPTDFGIFAIILAVQMLLQPLVDMGLTPAYVKVDNPTNQLKNSFFTVNVLLGVLNFSILILIAPIISSIYDNDLLLKLILVFSFSVLFSSFSRQGYAQLTRDKKFDKLMIISLLANISAFIVSLYAAYSDFGVWTLVIKSIVLSVVSMFFIFYFSETKYKMEKIKTIKTFKTEFKFGFEVFVNKILNGINSSADKFLFGKIFGLELLGNYSNSSQISRMADTHIRMPITTAIYSHLERYSPNDKKAFYDKFTSLVLLMTSMFSGLIILEGNVLLIYFLGDKWVFASKYIQPLGLFGIGMVLKGIYTIISMSENTMKKLNSQIVLSIFILLASLFLGYYLQDALLFIYTYSIVVFLYWFIIISKELLKHTDKINTFIMSIMYIFILIFLLFVFKINYLNTTFIDTVLLAFLFEMCMIVYIIYIYKLRRKK